MKGDDYDKADWKYRDKEFSEYDIWVSTRYNLPTYMQYEMEYKYKVYLSLPHKRWCDILSNIEAKDNSQ